MSVVWACPIPIEQMIRAGRQARPTGLRCPTCRGPLPLQGGYHRRLRHRGVVHRLWIWRGYCQPCDISHGLFPDFVVAHHLDTVDTETSPKTVAANTGSCRGVELTTATGADRSRVQPPETFSLSASVSAVRSSSGSSSQPSGKATT